MDEHTQLQQRADGWYVTVGIDERGPFQERPYVTSLPDVPLLAGFVGTDLHSHQSLRWEALHADGTVFHVVHTYDQGADSHPQYVGSSFATRGDEPCLFDLRRTVLHVQMEQLIGEKHDRG